MMIDSAGSAMTAAASAPSRAGLTAMPRSVVVSMSAIATTSIGRPARRAMSARCVRRTFTTPVPIVPKPSSPTWTASATAAGSDLSGARPCPRGLECSAERPPDAAHGLAGTVLVLDQREPHVVVAVLAEADAGRHGDLRLPEQKLRELERAHGLEGVRDLGPHEHGGARLRHVPARAREALAQEIATTAIGLADLLDVVLRAVESVGGRDLYRLEDTVVEVALDAGERRDDLRVPDGEADAPARHVVALG